MFYSDQTMIDEAKLTRLKDLLANSRSLLVLLGKEPTFDQVAAATALSQVMRQQGKEVLFASPQSDEKSDQPDEQLLTKLHGLDLLEHKLGNQNLVISFAYTETSVDKVTYHLGEESQRFFLTIKPQQGQPPIDTSSVEFSYTGVSADLIFLVGVHDPETLEELYLGQEAVFNDLPIITIHTFEPEMAAIALDTSGTSGASELVAQLCRGLEYPLAADAASDLLLGIEVASESFTQSKTTMATFELVATLMQAGAVRQSISKAARMTVAPAKKKLLEAKVEEKFVAKKTKIVEPSELTQQPSRLGRG